MFVNTDAGREPPRVPPQTSGPRRAWRPAPGQAIVGPARGETFTTTGPEGNGVTALTPRDEQPDAFGMHPVTERNRTRLKRRPAGPVRSALPPARTGSGHRAHTDRDHSGPDRQRPPGHTQTGTTPARTGRTCRAQSGRDARHRAA